MSKLKFELNIDTTTGEFSVVNVETGEVKSVSKKKSSKKKEESSEPTLTLEDNKYRLNQAAIDLMEIEPDCKIDIKYEKRGKKTIPVIGDDEVFNTRGGNRLTKSLTVACRGSKNSELSKYGTEFLIIPHEIKPGIFILQNKNDKLEEEIEFPTDEDLQNLIDDEDVTEINSSIFKL